jgi:hypothetical protein
MSQSKPFKIVKKSYGTEYWAKIKAYQAKNWDGSLAGYKPGTPEGERDVTEKKFVPDDADRPVRYTNYW